jgi:hypothetical protein
MQRSPVSSSSVTGTGSALTKVDLTGTNGVDPAFFVTPVSDASFNTDTISPFLQVDPSVLFAAIPGGLPTNSVPAIGAVNGASGTDWQLQADGNII